MGGVTVGLPLGGIIGFLLGGWLVLRYWRPATAYPVMARRDGRHRRRVSASVTPCIPGARCSMPWRRRRRATATPAPSSPAPRPTASPPSMPGSPRPGPTGPVIGLAYELAASGPPAKEVFAQLVIRLGAPDRGSTARRRTPATRVRSSCTPSGRGDIAIALSLYGAARPPIFGDGIGALYLELGRHRCRGRAVRRCLARRQRASWQRPPLHGGDRAHLRRRLSDQSPARTACLHHPEILETPTPIAARLGPHSASR